MTTHYSNAQNTKDLNVWAESSAHTLIRNCNKKDFHPVLCYSGMSGVALATALSLALQRLDPYFKFDMMYVRKPNEDSHGGNIEVTVGLFSGNQHKKAVGVFIDDFIEEGKTFRYVRDVAYKYKKLVVKYCLLEDYY